MVTHEPHIAERSKAARPWPRPFPKRHGPVGLRWPNNQSRLLTRAVRRGPAVLMSKRLRMDVDRLIERGVQPSLLSLNCHRLLEHRPGRRKIVPVPSPRHGRCCCSASPAWAWLAIAAPKQAALSSQARTTLASARPKDLSSGRGVGRAAILWERGRSDPRPCPSPHSRCRSDAGDRRNRKPG
jgi:hypothetical protein